MTGRRFELIPGNAYKIISAQLWALTWNLIDTYNEISWGNNNIVQLAVDQDQSVDISYRAICQLRSALDSCAFCAPQNNHVPGQLGTKYEELVMRQMFHSNFYHKKGQHKSLVMFKKRSTFCGHSRKINGCTIIFKPSVSAWNAVWFAVIVFYITSR